MTTTKTAAGIFRAADLSTPRGMPPANIGIFATLEEAQAAAESKGVAANIFEGWHLRGYTSGRLSGRLVFPSQGFRFNGCPCSLCA